MLSLALLKPNEERQKARQDKRAKRFDSRMKVREAKAGVGTQEALKNVSQDGSSGAKMDGSGESNILTYAMIGGGILIVGLTVFMLMKKKK
jgi:LPXTG-motif cell wall-anchored protein